PARPPGRAGRDGERRGEPDPGLLGQGLLRPAGQRERGDGEERGDRAGGAAVPVPAGGARRGDRAVHGRPGAGLGPGGAGELRCLALRGAASPRHREWRSGADRTGPAAGPLHRAAGAGEPGGRAHDQPREGAGPDRGGRFRPVRPEGEAGRVGRAPRAQVKGREGCRYSPCSRNDRWGAGAPWRVRTPRPLRGEEPGMSLVLYVIGFIVLVTGLAMAALQLGVSQSWIVIGIVVLVGIAILGIASNLERREPPHVP